MQRKRKSLKSQIELETTYLSISQRMSFNPRKKHLQSITTVSIISMDGGMIMQKTNKKT